MGRGRCVLIALKNSKDEVGVAEKNYLYPEGIYRFAGGGVDDGEEFSDAAVRELKEELEITVSKDRLLQIADFHISAYIESLDKNYFLQIRVYGLILSEHEKFNPSDDITGIVFLNKEDQEILIKNYTNLEGFIEEDGKAVSWNDYGKIFGPIHEYVFKHFI